MMGRKKLSEIRSELRREIEKRGEDAGKALDRLIEKARKKQGSSESDVEALRMLRSALDRRARAARKRPRPIKPPA
jgi:hypothetical protein